MNSITKLSVHTLLIFFIFILISACTKDVDSSISNYDNPKEIESRTTENMDFVDKVEVEFGEISIYKLEDKYHYFITNNSENDVSYIFNDANGEPVEGLVEAGGIDVPFMEQYCIYWFDCVCGGGGCSCGWYVDCFTLYGIGELEFTYN